MKNHFKTRYLLSTIIRIILSVICAYITYYGWIVISILTVDSLNKGVFEIGTPIATAFGFSLGIFIHERIGGIREAPFLSVLIWPLIGCSLGAILEYWLGTMIIFFGMFILGITSVVLREVNFRLKENR